MKCFSNYLNFRAKNIQRFFIQIIWIFAPKVSRFLKSLSNYLNFRAKSYFWIFAPKSISFDFSRHKEKNLKKLKNLNFCAKIRFEKMFLRQKIFLNNLNFYAKNKRNWICLEEKKLVIGIKSIKLWKSGKFRAQNYVKLIMEFEKIF